jgi:hypothetical protein
MTAYRAEHGTDDLLSSIRPGGELDFPAETHRVRDVFDVLEHTLVERTAYRIYRLVSRWYDNLVDNNQITANPRVVSVATTAGIARLPRGQTRHR